MPSGFMGRSWESKVLCCCQQQCSSVITVMLLAGTAHITPECEKVHSYLWLLVHFLSPSLHSALRQCCVTGQSWGTVIIILLSTSGGQRNLWHQCFWTESSVFTYIFVFSIFNLKCIMKHNLKGILFCFANSSRTEQWPCSANHKVQSSVLDEGTLLPECNYTFL